MVLIGGQIHLFQNRWFSPAPLLSASSGSGGGDAGWSGGSCDGRAGSGGDGDRQP